MGIFLKIWHRLERTKLLNFLSDKSYLKICYRINMGYQLNLKNPQTFNEKLQWLKLNNRKDIYTKMVDKYYSKEYVANIIGPQYIIPTIGIYDSFDEIDFGSLPEKFVMKCTHDSGGIIICKDKSLFDQKKAKAKINKCLKYNYYWHGREWPYKNIKPKIIIEQFLEDSLLNDIMDYKFFCFNGEPKFFKIDFDRYSDHRANYYNMDKKLIKVGEVVCPPDFNKNIKMPKNFELMTKFARKLSENIPFLRVDFYEVDGNVYFGELTFYPASGNKPFIYKDNDIQLGKLLEIKKD